LLELRQGLFDRQDWQFAQDSFRFYSLVSSTQKVWIIFHKLKTHLVSLFFLGKHFRNQEFIGYLTTDLAKIGIEVDLSFFCECHGKKDINKQAKVISKKNELTIKMNQLKNFFKTMH